MSEPRNLFCATCGKRRGGLEQQRKSWSCTSTPIVPRREAEGRPWQQTNDLIVMANIYRNGGTDETCHLCNACLLVGLRALLVAIEKAMDVTGGDADKDAEITRLTQQLGKLQHATKEVAILRAAGIPDYAWNHTEFLQAVAQQWLAHLAGFTKRVSHAP